MKTRLIMRPKLAYIMSIAAVGLFFTALLGYNGTVSGPWAAHGAILKSPLHIKAEALRDSPAYEPVSNHGKKQMSIESGNGPANVRSPLELSFDGMPTVSRMQDVQRDGRKARSGTRTYLSRPATESFADARSTMAPKTSDSASPNQVAARMPTEGQKYGGGSGTVQSVSAHSRPSSDLVREHASDQLKTDFSLFLKSSGATLENDSKKAPYPAATFATTQVRAVLTSVTMKATAVSFVTRRNPQSTTNFKLLQKGNSRAPTRTPTPTLTTAKIMSTDRIASSDNASAANLSELFRPLISRNESIAFTRCLQTLAERLNNASVTYFLYGGTLLGAYRHRGMIPWDDDMDIIANFSQQAVLRKTLENVPGYTMNIWSKWRYKFIADDALAIPGRKWKWPFIDIFFFNETDTRVLDSSPGYKGRYSYLKEDVFPLVYRPFDGLWLPVPVHERKIVEKDYGLKNCMSNSWSHKLEANIPKARVRSVPCEQLYKIHPFAFRNSTDLPVKETVKIGDLVVAEYVFPR